MTAFVLSDGRRVTPAFLLNLESGGGVMTPPTSFVLPDGQRVTGIVLVDADGAIVANPIVDPTQRTTLSDDFLSGGNTTGLIGDLAWIMTAGTATVLAAEANHPGIIRRDTGGSSGTVAFTVLRSNAGTGGAVESADFWAIAFLFRLNQVDADTKLRVGLSVNWSSQVPAEAAYLELLGTDTNFQFVTRHSSTETRANSTVAADTGWHWIQIRRVSASALGFTLDHGTEITATANLPTGGSNLPGWQIVNGAAASKTVDMDYFSLDVTGITR